MPSLLFGSAFLIKACRREEYQRSLTTRCLLLGVYFYNSPHSPIFELDVS